MLWVNLVVTNFDNKYLIYRADIGRKCPGTVASAGANTAARTRQAETGIQEINQHGAGPEWRNIRGLENADKELCKVVMEDK